jgi:hypothetical protein
MKIKHLLRRHSYEPPKGGAGGRFDQTAAANVILDQARELYLFWHEVFADRAQNLLNAR